MKLILLLLLILFTGSAVFAQCTLKLADLPDAPELMAFRMGMTPAQVKARVPQVAFEKPNEYGIAKTSISPDFDSRIDKASFPGVRTLSLDFLDDRVTSLWFGYDSTFKWQNVPDFVAGISQSLHLPDSWTTWKIRGQQIKCTDFQLTVIMLGDGPSFHIIDQKAEQTIAERREALEEQAEQAKAEVIADKKTKLYYSNDCQPDEEIKDINRVVFKSSGEAEQAGYKLGKKCE
jgi:hypothetical protein